MQKLARVCVFLFPIGVAQANPMCDALQQIDAASVSGFKDIPTHLMKGVPDEQPEAIIPGGSGQSLSRGMGRNSKTVLFTVNVNAKSRRGLHTVYEAAKRGHGMSAEGEISRR